MTKSKRVTGQSRRAERRAGALRSSVNNPLPKRNFFAGAAVVVLSLLTCSTLSTMAGKIPAGFTEHFADVNGVKLDYFIGGKGSPVVPDILTNKNNQRL